MAPLIMTPVFQSFPESLSKKPAASTPRPHTSKLEIWFGSGVRAGGEALSGRAHRSR